MVKMRQFKTYHVKILIPNSKYIACPPLKLELRNTVSKKWLSRDRNIANVGHATCTEESPYKKCLCTIHISDAN